MKGKDKFLRKWKIDNLVRIVTFDTTSTKTGIEKGSAYLLESKLGRDFYRVAIISANCLLKLYLS